MKTLWYVNIAVTVVQVLGFLTSLFLTVGGADVAIAMSVVGLVVACLCAAAGFLFFFGLDAPLIKGAERFCAAFVGTSILAICASLAVLIFAANPRDEAWIGALLCAAFVLSVLLLVTRGWNGPWWVRLICLLPLGSGVVLGGLLLWTDAGKQRAAI